MRAMSASTLDTLYGSMYGALFFSTVMSTSFYGVTCMQMWVLMCIAVVKRLILVIRPDFFIMFSMTPFSYFLSPVYTSSF